MISMVVAIVVLIMAVPFMGQYQLNRITSIGDVAVGNDIEGKSDNRSFVWIYATGEIFNNDPVWGMGHNSMDNIVPVGEEGIGPHNLYIWIWGNSGLVGLGALIIYLFYFFVLARRFSDPLMKASGLVFAFLIVANNFMTHALIAHQTTSVGIMFFIVLLFHLDKSKIAKVPSLSVK
jgi:O-antigen ligase